METYIRKAIKGYYIEVPEKISTDLLGERLGTTYEDFIDNKWIHLSPEQVKFHEDNPTASIQEVLRMELNIVPPISKEQLISQAK